MADEKDLVRAKSVYEDICSAFDEREIKYTRHDDDLVLTLSFSGDDLPMDFIVRVNPDAQVVSMYSKLPVTMPEDKRVEGAVAACIASYGIVNGSFDYNISDGTIVFRVVESYRDSIIAGEVYIYMIMIANGTVDKYNDRFLMLSKGMMDIQKFIEMEQE